MKNESVLLVDSAVTRVRLEERRLSARTLILVPWYVRVVTCRINRVFLTDDIYQKTVYPGYGLMFRLLFGGPALRTCGITP